MSKPQPPSTPDPLSVQRGIYTRTLTGPLLFSTFRLLSGPIQWLLIRSHPLSRFGIPPPPQGGTISLPTSMLSLLPISLPSTLPRFPLIMAALPTLLSLKHILWITTLCNERMTLPFAFFGGFSDLIYECISSIVFTAADANPTFSPALFYTGSALYVAAVGAELACEVQRYRFKADPGNKGKLCKSGLWALCRHPNYAANVLFGVGYGLAAGGPGYAVATGGMYLGNFVYNAVPGIEAFCRDKYKGEWEGYEREVPWKLFPGIY